MIGGISYFHSYAAGAGPGFPTGQQAGRGYSTPGQLGNLTQ
jgi:hypothetical protein